MGEERAWIVYKNATIQLDENQVKQLVSMEMWVLVILLVGYGSNDKKVEDMRSFRLDNLPFRSTSWRTCNTPIFWAWAVRNQSLWSQLWMSILWGRRERLNQCRSSKDSLAPWSLDATWIVQMADSGKIFLVLIVGMVVLKNRKVKNLGIEEAIVSRDYKDDFVNK